MKKYLIIFPLLAFCCFLATAQNKTVVLKVEVKQQEKLTLEALEDPAFEGDENALQTSGGTYPYHYTWEKTDNEKLNSYKITVQDNNECTATIYINVEGVSNVEELELASGLYPNPTSDLVNVPLPQEQEVTIMLINTEGRLLYQKQINGNAATYQLSLATCMPGKYFVQVVGSQTKTYSVIKK